MQQNVLDTVMPMNAPSETVAGTLHRCPACDTALPFEPHMPPFSASCLACGYSLWCSKRRANDNVVLDVVPGRTPDVRDIDRVVESLVHTTGIAGVRIDLSRIEAVTCAFIARLVTLNKRLKAAGTTLTLCGLRPIVRETFDRLGLDRAFSIAGGGPDA